MKRKKIDSFTLFVILLLALILTLLGMLLAGMKEEKRQFTVLLPLGDLAYDEDFLQKAKKIKGIKEIWPVIEVPVVIKIEDYTETTTFSGIDMNAFGKNPPQNELGKMPLLLLGNGSFIWLQPQPWIFSGPLTGSTVSNFPEPRKMDGISRKPKTPWSRKR